MLINFDPYDFLYEEWSQEDEMIYQDYIEMMEES